MPNGTSARVPPGGLSMIQAGISNKHEEIADRPLRVQAVRDWRGILRDLFYDIALAVLWVATLWLLVMDVMAS